MISACDHRRTPTRFPSLRRMRRPTACDLPLRHSARSLVTAGGWNRRGLGDPTVAQGVDARRQETRSPICNRWERVSDSNHEPRNRRLMVVSPTKEFWMIAIQERESVTQPAFSSSSSLFAAFVFPSDYAVPFSVFLSCLCLYFLCHPSLFLLD